MNNLNISKERKNEIDNILKENQRKFENGELEKHSLKEFKEKYEIRRKEFEKLCMENDRLKMVHSKDVGTQYEEELLI